MVNKFAISQMTIGRGLKWALVAQVVLAVFLVIADIDRTWIPRIGSQPPLPSGPVSPGDQVRRYDPSRPQPEFTDRPDRPMIDLPSEFPARLEFSMVDAADDTQVLLLNGPINSGDSERFTNYLAGMSTPPETVALNSPGGVVSEALLIGRGLREAEANTIMLPGMICLSSCPYIFAAGQNRHVSRTAALGLHQHYYGTPGYMPVFLAVEGIQYGQGQTLEYLIEMGVDPGLMVYSLNTPPEEIYLLVEEELLQTQLATEMIE
ncbi:hypothetical protein LY56_03325 [Roseinatronobacter thiooxidans]|uniref:ATP-dependent protease ClpP protease subunit n=1 Tax=Roseinatronobacter thiooxidans TaxID=121821 RepID=A0A2W7RG94_9RHOB|nr:hypothetical protein LY56_03325 [Roseinatronobacter thiooxidans]